MAARDADADADAGWEVSRYMSFAERGGGGARGNGAAVAVGAPGEGDREGAEERMKALARRLGEPVTAFVWPEEGARPAAGTPYRVRWFTAGAHEVPLCGHASLAVGEALAARGAASAAGEVELRRASDGRRLVAARDEASGAVTLAFPALETRPRAGPPPPAGSLAGVRDADVLRSGEVGDDGWVVVELATAEAVRDARPDREQVLRHYRGTLLLIARDPARGPEAVVSRAFCPASGIDEDQACGSAHCAAAPFYGDAALSVRQLSPNGAVMRVELDAGAGEVRLTGHAVPGGAAQ